MKLTFDFLRVSEIFMQLMFDQSTATVQVCEINVGLSLGFHTGFDFFFFFISDLKLNVKHSWELERGMAGSTEGKV